MLTSKLTRSGNIPRNFSVCHQPVDLLKKGTWCDVFSKREDDNGLNRQLDKPRIVYAPFLLGGGGGGQEWCIEGGNSVTVKDI